MMYLAIDTQIIKSLNRGYIYITLGMDKNQCICARILSLYKLMHKFPIELLDTLWDITIIYMKHPLNVKCCFDIFAHLFLLIDTLSIVAFTT